MLGQDLRFAVRTLTKRPGFSAVAIVTLALGIGANSAIFSVVSAVLLRPLPYPEPERLAKIVGHDLASGELDNLSPADFMDLRDANRSFEVMGAHGWVGFFTIAGDGEPERLSGSNVTRGFFRTLGVQPQMGRLFQDGEDVRGAEPVAVITDAFWERRFGGRTDTLGRVVNFNAIPTTIVGILPDDYRHPEPNPEREPEVYIPYMWDLAEPNRGGHFIRAIGRLNPDVTIEQAQAELTTIASQLEQEYPTSNIDQGVNVSPLLDAIVRESRLALLLLLGAVGFVLLVACANIANLLLASGAARRKELAVRAALGAGRARIVRQLMTESLVLAAVGGALGLAVAYWAMRGLTAVVAERIPRAEGMQLDGSVLAFTLVIVTITGVAFGLAPALQLSRRETQNDLREGARGQGDHAGRGAREALIAAEVALSLVLLIGAGLLMQSLWRLQRIDPGFRPERVLTMQMALPTAKYAEGDQVPVYEQLYERLERVPGVDVVGAINILPLSDSYDGNGFQIDERPMPVGQNPSVQTRSVNSDYFRALGIPLLRGRVFDERDRRETPGVVVISDVMARRFWPDEDPIGKRITYNRGDFDEPTQTVGGPGSREIVGIVGSVKHLALEEDLEAMFYTPQTQQPSFHTMTLVLRGAVDPASLGSSVRAEVAELDPDVPLFQVRTLDAMLDRSVAQPRLRTWLLGLFSAVALGLALIGIYGVIGYLVGQRTHEIGIRMALGAGTRDVVQMLLWQSMRPVVVGVGVGLAIALALSRLVATLLYGVAASDPLTYAAVAALLACTAMVATLVPALRATRIDPSTALRSE
jgi:putative ABC transport system permease protein